jgi:hypothetical protein
VTIGHFDEFLALPAIEPPEAERRQRLILHSGEPLRRRDRAGQTARASREHAKTSVLPLGLLPGVYALTSDVLACYFPSTGPRIKDIATGYRLHSRETAGTP